MHGKMPGGSHSKLQRQMKKQHAFLYKLFKEKSGRKNRATLQKANHNQVWVVLRVLFCISAGHIPLKFKNFQKLITSKRRNTLRSLKNRMRYLRSESTEKKKKFILQFASLFPYLFYDLFIDEKNDGITRTSS